MLHNERPAISVALRGSSYFGPTETRYYNPYRESRSYTRTDRLPRKVMVSKEPPSSGTIKSAITNLARKPIGLQPTSIPTNTPPPYPTPKTSPGTDMAPIFQIHTLQRKQILHLLENSEGDICFQDVSEQDLDGWKKKNPDLLEADDIRFEYNFLNQRFIIKCMPTATHDSLQDFFLENVFGTLVEKIGFSKAKGLVGVGSGTTFGGFKGDSTGSSEKQPDAYVKLRGAKFPAIVCEAGLSEKLEDLIADARLWLLHTGGVTKIVIVLSITECDTQKTSNVTPGATDVTEKIMNITEKSADVTTDIALKTTDITEKTADFTQRTTDIIKSTTGTTEKTTNIMEKATEIALKTTGITEKTINVTERATNTGCTARKTTNVIEKAADVPKLLDNLHEKAKPLTEEEVLIRGITAGTNLSDLAEKLQTLNTRAKLTKPLVSNITVTVYMYRACDKGRNIEEIFEATVIPAPPASDKTPTEFKITFADIFGEKVPDGVKATDCVSFDLAELKKFVTESLPDTEWLRATRLAKKILKEAGEWEEMDTFAQQKRRKRSRGSWEKDEGEWEEKDPLLQHKRPRRGSGGGLE